MLSGFLWPSLFLLCALCPFCFNKFPFDYAIGLSIYGPKHIRTFEISALIYLVLHFLKETFDVSCLHALRMVAIFCSLLNGIRFLE